MVYISTPALTGTSRTTVMQAQNDLSKAQKELSSGTLADVGLSLGSQSGHLTKLTQQQSLLQAMTDSNALVNTRLTSTASALTTLQTTASSFLASLTTAASAGATSTDLQATAAGNLSALISTMNTSVDGDYIFGGINSSVQPMTTYTSGSANKQAVDSAFSSAFGIAQDSDAAGSINGASMQSFLGGDFASLFSADGYATDWSSASTEVMTSEISPGQTVDTSVSANSSAIQKLTQAYTMVKEFGGANLGTDANQAVISSATALVNSALSDLTNMQASVGVSQSSLSGANDNMAAQISLLSTQSDAMTGVDTYDLSTKLNSLQTQIQASYEVTSKLQEMSLVSYIR